MKWRNLWSRLRGSLRSDDALEHEMNEGNGFHLEMSSKRNIERGCFARGESTGEARIRRQGSDQGSARKAHRRCGGTGDGDVRSLASLRRTFFTAGTVLSLALVAAQVRQCFVVDAVLRRPLRSEAGEFAMSDGPGFERFHVRL